MFLAAGKKGRYDENILQKAVPDMQETGVLGREVQEMKARDIMMKDTVTVSPDTPVRKVAELMVTHGLCSVPVVDASGAVLGMVSEGDLLRKKIAPKAPQVLSVLGEYEGIEEYREAFRKMGANTSGEIMTSPVITVQVDDEAQKVGEAVLNNHIKQVPVMENGKLVGLISRSNLLKWLLI